jgi:hypothetical protein
LAWTSPRTWASGYVVLAADLNTHLRDNLNVTAPAVMTTAGDIIYASGSNTPARLAKDTNSTRSLTNTGSSNIPAWAQVALATGVSGTLPVGNGGTGQTSLTTGAILIGNGSSAVTMVTQTTKGQILIGDGSGAPQMLGVGSNTYVLTADSGETTGVKWAAAASSNNLVENLEDFIEGNATKVLYMMGGATEQTPAANALCGLGFNHGGSGGTVTGDSVVGGAWSLLTSSGDTGERHIESAAHLSADEDWVMDCRMLVPNEASRSVLFGLTENNDPNLATNNMIAWTVSGTGNYIFKTDSGGSETTRDTGTAATDAAEHRFRIEISGNGGTIKAYFDNAQVGADVTTNIPSSATMRLMAGVKNASASPGRTLKLMDVVAWRDV